MSRTRSTTRNQGPHSVRSCSKGLIVLVMRSPGPYQGVKLCIAYNHQMPDWYLMMLFPWLNKERYIFPITVVLQDHHSSLLTLLAAEIFEVYTSY